MIDFNIHHENIRGAIRFMLVTFPRLLDSVDEGQAPHEIPIRQTLEIFK